MDKRLLLKPVPKPAPRGCVIQKNYPFPIVGQSAIASTSTDDPKQQWKCFIGYIKGECVLVTDEESVNMLFDMGFFGKGTLSKRGPGFHSSEKNLSQSTEQRSSSDDEGTPGSKRKKVDHENIFSIKADPVATTQEKSSDVEHSVSSSASQKESLQLTFQEAFFLSYGLGCLVVMDTNNKPLDLIKLWKKFCELSSSHDFPVMYTAYHHFRSKGWVVRSGLNYGAHYVLYKDGPVFYHSTYAVIVKEVNEKDLSVIENSGRLPMTWPFLAALNRINSHVAKGVVFAFVLKPQLLSDHILTSPLCVSRFKIQELLLKRWVPTAEREK